MHSFTPHMLVTAADTCKQSIFCAGFGVATLCLAQSQWFQRDSHPEIQVIQRDSQRDEERGVIIDFRKIGCFIATPCLYVSEREIYDLLFTYAISAHGFIATPCLYVSEREIYDLLFTYTISAHMLKSLHRLVIAIIMDSTDEEWMTKKLMLN